MDRTKKGISGESMTNKPEVVQPIDKRTLSRAHYFQSLLEKAAPLGLLENAGDIKRQTLALAAKLAQRLTFGASSSIKEETAQALLESIFYCISRRLKTMETGKALEALRQRDIESIWNEGRELTRGDVERARIMLKNLRAGALITENIAYNDTLGEGLDSFFKAYDIDFAAHENPCMIDYFLCVELPELSGAEYILAYMERLGMENEFCAHFGEVEALQRSHSPYWRELNTSIFDIVLTNAIGRVLCGRDMSGLDISEDDRAKLEKSLGGMSKQRLKAVLCAASQRVCTQVGASEALKDYALAAAGQISSHVHFALQTDALNTGSPKSRETFWGVSQVFVSLKTERQKTRFEDRERMDDDAFRILTDEIRSCRHLEDKLALIRGINSIGDLADMLGASCLYGEEYEAMFRALGDDVLALLYLRFPEDSALHITEAEREWHMALVSYLEKAGKAEYIRKAAEEMEEIEYE